MDQSFYNSKDKKYQEVIELLNSLPKIKSPENFDYKLKLRIENNNFTTADEIPKKTKNKFSVLIPAFGLVLSVFVLFYLFSSNSLDVENPFSTLPEVYSKIPGLKADTFGVSHNSAIVEETGDDSNSGSERENNLAELNDTQSFRVILHPNDVVQKEKVPYPFDTTKTIDLDSFIGRPSGRDYRNTAAKLAGGHPEFNFNGFYTRETNNKKVGELKAKIESVKKNNLEKREIRQDKNKRKIVN